MIRRLAALAMVCWLGCAAWSEPAVVRDLPYGEHERQRLDIYRPAASPNDANGPVVLWIHGGGWRIGDKRHSIAPKARLLTEAGYCLVAANYRLAGEDESIPFPRNTEDVAAAIAWIHGNIAQYGGDPERIVLMGHSAGAHLVSLVATDGRYLAAHGLTLADLAGVVALDTEGYDVARAMGGRVTKEIYENAFGTDPSIWKTASPVSHIAAGKDIPPFLVATRGTAARVANAKAFADALRGAGYDAAAQTIPGYSHADVNRKLGEPGEEAVTAPVMAFLKKAAD